MPALEQKGWTPIRWRRFEINTTPQETTENSVDFGHFTQLHGFVAAEIRRPLDTDGAFLRTTYQGHRPIGLPGVRRFPIAVEYDVKVSGLGYSQVDVEIEALRLYLRLWVLPVPVEAARIHLVLGASAPTRLGLLTYPARYTAHTMLCREVEQDLDVWNYKTFVERPALAKGDGPVAQYRKWAERFYHSAPPTRPTPGAGVEWMTSNLRIGVRVQPEPGTSVVPRCRSHGSPDAGGVRRGSPY